MALEIGIFAGIVLIGALGIAGRRPKDLSEWTVNERTFPRWTSWFLQAGESLTTFSFLGLAGIAFTGGVSATFAIAYLSISAAGLYFVAPRIWQLGRDRGYITQGDFFADRFNSQTLAKVASLVGALFLLPYLQLQITGLGLVVQLATGSSAGRGFSMVLASVLVVLFVTMSGIRGIARVAIFKDILMLVALAIVLCGVLFSVAGIPDVFSRVKSVGPDLLTLDAPGYGTTFFLTAVIVTGIGASLNTFPHLWPPMYAAKSGEILRSNYTWLALYQFLLFIPITVGMAAVLVLSKATTGNTVLLTMAGRTLPDWLVVVVAIGGASAAMVPASAISMGISTLLSRNVFPVKDEKAKLRLNAAFVAGAVFISLAFGLGNSDIGSLLLLTYGGLTQTAPAILIGLRKKVTFGAVPVLLGMVVGVLTVAWLTFFHVDIGAWDSGFIALGPNIVVLLVAEAVRRSMRRSGDAVPAVQG